MNYNEYKKLWSNKTKKQIEKELISWKKYVAKNESAYHWHGKDITPPGSLADGDKITILKELLK